MPAAYHIVNSSHFDRDYESLAKKNPQVISRVEAMVEALRHDPYNRSTQHNIKKLKGLKKGEGQWRIASGDYRIRYDIFGRNVVLYSCKPRREAYQS
jgi:mRNA-degrading endonuclease RelE of RelBE toxin-antitoxin system